ncbi:hypothetical protein cce_0498 [Crocosphaera subtropica ATCC 51142]|uniref:Uncharacterized protein n=1 Tax=Crocosphaera subtropica (strain ATCC 51142 / BH68) TaxID=43989 RepID=B1WP67_CROS5|nr:hypothetical protein cce_0498 [Crocosphaera subtropica ATCC 51142]
MGIAHHKFNLDVKKAEIDGFRTQLNRHLTTNLYQHLEEGRI